MKEIPAVIDRRYSAVCLLRAFFRTPLVTENSELPLSSLFERPTASVLTSSRLFPVCRLRLLSARRLEEIATWISVRLSGPHTLESGAPVVVDAPDLFQPGNSGVRLFWKTDQVRFRMDVRKNVIGILEEVVRVVISGDVPPAFITEIGEALDHVPCVLHRGLDEDNRPQFTNGRTRAVQHLWFHAFNVDFYQVALVKRETVEGDHIGRNAFSLAARFHCTSITFDRGIYQGNLDRTR